MASKRRYWFIFLFLGFSCVHAEESFPVPAELQPDVDFWVAIFTRYDTDEGVLHDNRNLDVVYERIDAAGNLSRRELQRRVQRRREHLQTILRNLARGNRNNLSDEESRILALWPADVSNKTLAAAASRIRHQQGLRDRFQKGLVRAGRWRNYLEKEFRLLGVPVELAALPHVESSYNPDARSNAGASGLWQFTRSTGRRFLRVDHVLDERNDPFAATRAAGKLLAYNYSITGNWPMAITAYNHGLGGVLRAMRKYGDSAYADIFRHYGGRRFGFASRNFYVAFVAAKHVDQNVEQYFPALVVESPTDYAIVDLPAFVSVGDLAASLGVSAKQLAAHNPALQATVRAESKLVPKGYSVRIPNSLIDGRITSRIDAVAADNWHTGQLPDLFHTVVRGDTLSEIADAYNTRVSTLVALNNLGNRHRIKADQNLRLPAAGPAPVTVPTTQVPAVAAAVVEPEVADNDGPDIEEQMVPVMGEELAEGSLGTVQTSLLSDPSDYSVAGDTTIEVQPLETLGHYADWLGIRTQRLRDLNGLSFRAPVEVGKRLKLDVSRVDGKSFEEQRIAFHRAQQDSFFRQHVITGVTEHVIRSGESIWILALRQYDVPVWLFRQYNPGVDLSAVRPGTKVSIPVLVARGRS